jgi:hypothetical protein
MDETIPGHHIKQDVCNTRPKYREGRKPKGVKVGIFALIDILVGYYSVSRFFIEGLHLCA